MDSEGLFKTGFQGMSKENSCTGSLLTYVTSLSLRHTHIHMQTEVDRPKLLHMSMKIAYDIIKVFYLHFNSLN